MRILFIGGTRFIGRATVYQLVGGGHDVAVFNRGETPNSIPDEVQRIYGDLANLEDFVDVFRKFKPDVVIHTLLMEQGDATQMMRVLRGVAPRVVVISSMDVYLAWGRLLDTEPGAPIPMPLTEISPLRVERFPYRNQGEKDWRYYYDKIPVEQVAMSFKEPVATVLRLPMVYGEADYQFRLQPYLQRMDDKRSHIVMDERHYHWVAPRAYVENIAYAIVLAATKAEAAKRIYHVAEPHFQALSEANWVRAIGRVAGWDGDVVPASSDMLPPPMQFNPHGQNVTADSSRIRNELGFTEVVSFERGLERTIAWMRELVLPHLEPLDYQFEDHLIATLTAQQ